MIAAANNLPENANIIAVEETPLERIHAYGVVGVGERKGDVFAIYSPNLPEYAVIFLAVASVGGINTTVNPLYTADELAKQLVDSRARFLVTVPPFLDKAQEAARKSGVEAVFVFGAAEGARPFAELLQGGGDPPTVALDPANDLVVLPYSSGTWWRISASAKA